MDVSVELFAYPWDVIDEGAAPFLDRCLELGVNRLHIAVSYHSGKFLLPRHSRTRVYFPEPGALYFQPDPNLWRGGLDQPVSSLAPGNWLEQLAREARARRIELSAWTVFFHNSALGAHYPELILRNAFGDPYPFALCPSRAEVQDHAGALCRSLASLGFFAGIDLETIGYLGYFHGHHHEVTAVPLGLAEKFLLSLCFCDACRSAGSDRGIDVDRVACQARRFLARRLQSDDASSGNVDEAEHLSTLLILYPAFQELIRLRLDTVTELVKRLKREAGGTSLAAFTSSFVGSPSNIWMEGVSPAAIKELVSCFHLLAYASEVEAANSDLAFFLAMIEDSSLVNLTINLGLPLTKSFAEAAAKVDYGRNQGVRRFSFFNYSFLGEGRLRWIRELARISRSDSR
jgi:hypothetical protein